MNGKHSSAPESTAEGATNKAPLSTDRQLHTPGPWKWEINLKTHHVQLCGRGLTVMDFVRWGMGGAAPRFIDAEQLMNRAETLTAIVPGREHHARWYQTLNHPDANLIAAAPDLFDIVRDLVEYSGGMEYDDWRALVRRAETALVKVRLIKAEGNAT